jgi:protein TonB
VLGVGVLLAVAIHAGVLFAVLWRAELAPIRERLVRVVLFPSREDAGPPAPPAAAPEPAPPPPDSTTARARAPRRPSVSLTAPAPPPEGPASDTDSDQAPPVASAPAPAARATTSASPRYKNNPEPPYPVLARRRRQEGVVLLLVRVDAAGMPESVAVQTSSGFASLDDAAVAAVKSWEFEPGQQDGRPVPSQVEVPIRFQLRRD